MKIFRIFLAKSRKKLYLCSMILIQQIRSTKSHESPLQTLYQVYTNSIPSLYQLYCNSGAIPFQLWCNTVFARKATDNCSQGNEQFFHSISAKKEILYKCYRKVLILSYKTTQLHGSFYYTSNHQPNSANAMLKRLNESTKTLKQC